MPKSRRPDKFNVVLIVMDAVRTDHLSCYGYGRSTSPRIDDIAKQGQLFLTAISAAPGTLSSMPSIPTGLFVSEHGMGPLNRRLDRSFVTLAEWLRTRGYSTAAFSNNAWVSEATGLNRGFSTFRQISRLFPPGGHPTLAQVWAERSYRLLISERHDMGDRAAIQESIKWINGSLDQSNPFFVLLHLMEGHSPYDPPNPYYGMFLPESAKRRRRSFPRRVLKRIRHGTPEFHLPPETESQRQEIIALYDGSIRYVDELIGWLHAQMADLGVLENTLLIITADHGENLGDHGLLGHGGCLYETLIHVPLICVHRGIFPPSQRIESVVQAHDVFPTIVNLLGGDESLGFDSVRRSLPSYHVRDKAHQMAFSEDPRYGAEHLVNTGLDVRAYDRALSAVRTDRWKYILGTDGSEELYDLQSDPGEEADLIDVESAGAAELREQLNLWRAGLSAFEGEAVRGELDNVVAERLRALGYID